MESGLGAVKVDKLNDSNFHSWKQKIQLLLSLRELDDFIHDDPPSIDSDNYRDWCKNDRKAMAHIGLSLSDHHLEHVRDVSTAKEMWLCILNIFERHTLLNKLAARRNFYTATMKEDENIMAFTNRIRQLASTLKSMGVEIDDKEMAMAVLNGLPERFNNLISALDALGNEDSTFSLEFVKSRLLQEEQRIRMRENASNTKSEASALLANRRKTAYHKCGHCGKEGHPSERCYKKFPDLAPEGWHRKPKKDQSKSTALVTDQPSAVKVMDEKNLFCLMAKVRESNVQKESNFWLIDSGCTSHMTFDRSAFSSYKILENLTVEMGTKDTVKIAGKGDIFVQITVNGTASKIKLCDVLHVPDFGYQLLSVSKMDLRGVTITFKSGRCTISTNNTTIATGSRHGSLYVLDRDSTCTTSESAYTSTVKLWHERLAHVDSSGIRSMVNNGVVKGINLSSSSTSTDACTGCVYGKGHQAPIPKASTSRSSALLELVHSDVLGPVNVSSLGGSRYFISFIDDFSKWTTVFTMRYKSESFEYFKQFHKYAETHTDKKVQRLNIQKYTSDSEKLKTLRTDNGGEYLSTDFRSYLAENGIRHQLTVAYTPQQNGVAERMNRTLMNLVRSMLHQRNIDKRFWAEALSTAVYIRNRVTSRGLPANTTPHHIWMGCPPDLAHLRVFGSKCWYILPKQKVKKLDPRAREGMMIGYSSASKAYKLWDPEDKKVVISRSVKFDEGVSRGTMMETSVLDDGNDSDSSSGDEKESEDSNEMESSSDPATSTSTPVGDNPSMDDESQPITDAPLLRRSTRVSRPPVEFWKATPHSTTLAIESCNLATQPTLLATDVPRSYQEATSPANLDLWKPAIDKEHSSITRNKTWKLVERTPGMNVLPCMYVFTLKESGPKARIVAKGCRQVHGVDYGETYAPVVKFTSVRVMLATVAVHDLELHQMDVVTAFLHGELDTDIYMEIPAGFRTPSRQSLVCKLLKALYGLKQAPRLWHAKIDTFLITDLSFTSSPNDPCLYVRHTSTRIMIIALYVDDLLIAGDDTAAIVWIKGELQKRFEMKDLGEARVCLGLEIARDRPRRTLRLSQENYMQSVLERFSMHNSKPAATPMESGFQNTRWYDPEASFERAVSVPYRQAIGCLMFLYICTRPDIGFAVCCLAKFSEEPLVPHWVAVKRVLRYIAGTRDFGITFGIDTNAEPVGYTDSDWGGCRDSRKSTSGYIFMIAGAPVCWRSKKQTIVATSSCEAEYVASCSAAKEAVWLSRLLKDIQGHTKPLPICVFADNQGSIDSGKNQAVTQRNKHIDIQYHYVRDVVAQGKVKFVYCPTNDMAADALTKPLDRVLFEKHVQAMGVSSKSA